MRTALAGAHPYDALGEQERAKIDRRVTWDNKVPLAGGAAGGSDAARAPGAFNHGVLRALHRVHSVANGEQTALLRAMHSNDERDAALVATYKPVVVKISSRVYEGHAV